MSTDARRVARARSFALPTWVPAIDTLTVSLIAILTGIGFVALSRPLDTDLWWHLKDGLYILNHHVIPRSDFFSFTFAGHSWIDHEWGAEVLMAGLYRLGGFWLLGLVFAVIITATSTLIYQRSSDLGASRLASLLMLIGTFAASVGFWGERPQIITLLFLAIYALALDSYRRTPTVGKLIVFPALMILWVNLHGGFVLGLALMVMTVLGEWLNHRFTLENALSSREVRLLGGASLLTLGATLINPTGITEVLYPLVWIKPSLYTNWLTEWVSTNFHQPLMMVFEAMLLVLVGSVYIARPKTNWVHLLVALAFTHLALEQVRNVAVWCVLVGPFVALYATQAARSLNRRLADETEPAKPAIFTLPLRRSNSVLAAIVLLGFFVAGVQYFRPGMFTNYQRTEFPAAAATYLNAHPNLPRNVFSEYGWGGYVIWRNAPHYRDFIDGRANTLFSDKLLADYLQIYGGGPKWNALLNQYNVGTVLVMPSAPIAQLLALSPNWEIAYRDHDSVVYRRLK